MCNRFLVNLVCHIHLRLLTLTLSGLAVRAVRKDNNIQLCYSGEGNLPGSNTETNIQNSLLANYLKKIFLYVWNVHSRKLSYLSRLLSIGLHCKLFCSGINVEGRFNAGEINNEVYWFSLENRHFKWAYSKLFKFLSSVMSNSAFKRHSAFSFYY